MNELTQILIGLQIFAANECTTICAEHDEIFAGHGCTALNAEELRILKACGWVWNEEIDGWRRYV